MSGNTGGQPALLLDNVSKSFGDKAAVRELSMQVPAGAVFGLLGPNGAGKSTTIRMALNIYVPDSGTVRVFGRAHGGNLSNSIGYLPEERGLYTKMKVADMLRFMGAIKGVPAGEVNARIGRWLERIELPGCEEKKVHELSKGMQQKVQFVATVLHNPELIILDEPFSGLDPINANLLKDIIVDLRAQGRAIIFSTHVMEQAERLCDEICLINSGQKILEGPVSSIRGRYGRNAIALAFAGDGAFLQRHPLVKSVNEYNSYVELRLVDGADPQALLSDIVGRVRVTRFEVLEPSLHDIFIERVTQTQQHPAGEVIRG